MAPKRSDPQPPPSAASSEETASGSGSEESEEEEEIAYSPPPAAPPPPPKTTAPPPQKGQESEESEEDEDDEEEEEEEEEDEKANHVPPPPATKNPFPPPPPNREESDNSGDEEEEEETDDEKPQLKPAPNPEAKEGKGAKPSSREDKKPGAPFQRTWSTDDEVRILEAMAAYSREHGTPPQPEALLAALAGSLDNSGCSLAMLQSKVRNLKRRYSLAAKRGELPSKDHDRRLFDLSKSVWGPVANGGARREVGEMCELYPHLAEEVRAVEKAHPGLFKREFEMIDDDKARVLEEKIKKQRRHQMRLHQKHHDLIKEVTKTLIDLSE